MTTRMKNIILFSKSLSLFLLFVVILLIACCFLPSVFFSISLAFVSFRLFDSHLTKGQQVMYLMKKEIDQICFESNEKEKEKAKAKEESQLPKSTVGLTEFHSDPSLQLLELSYLPTTIVGVHFEDNLYNPFYTISTNNSARELQTDIMR
jgi:hypothetical protein